MQRSTLVGPLTLTLSPAADRRGEGMKGNTQRRTQVIEARARAQRSLDRAQHVADALPARRDHDRCDVVGGDLVDRALGCVAAVAPGYDVGLDDLHDRAQVP